MVRLLPLPPSPVYAGPLDFLAEAATPETLNDKFGTDLPVEPQPRKSVINNPKQKRRTVLFLIIDLILETENIFPQEVQR
jgi:hypothetical protein